MRDDFRAVIEPPRELIDPFSDLYPDNPFCTYEYLQSKRSLGSKTYLFEVLSNGKVKAACLAFSTTGRLNSRLEIPSLPVLTDPGLFWKGVFGFCEDENITVLSVHTFGSIESNVCESDSLLSRKKRYEYRLDLSEPDLKNKLNRRHQRKIKRARSHGLTIRRSKDQDFLRSHAEIANLSLKRRFGRGEAISGGIGYDEIDALVRSGAAEIFQAVSETELMSSILVVKSRTGAYAQSSGTSENGRDIGSSHLLFHEVACILQAEGIELFNLGGTDEDSEGLKEFKAGTGAARVDLESAEYFTGSKLRLLASRVAAILRPRANLF